MGDTKIKVTNEQMLTFRANAQGYVRIHSKEKMNKFAYALTKMISRTNADETRYNEEVNDLRVDHASLDEKGNLISKEINGQQGQTYTKYEFTPAKLKELNKKVKELGKKEIEIEPYICTGDIPEDVNLPLQEVFVPFVMTEVIDEFEEKVDEVTKE